jgi:diguanylate cyclase (GGDEF)-like protein/PAS domain S-box-containing protein
MRLSAFRLSTLVTAAMLVLLAMVAGLYIVGESRRVQEIYLTERGDDLEQKLRLEELRLKQAVGTLAEDVRFLAATPPVSGIIRARHNRDFDPRDGDTLERWKHRLEQIFAAFVAAHPDYRTVRYITLPEAREVVRIDFQNGRSIIAAPRALAQLDDPPLRQALAAPGTSGVYLSDVIADAKASEGAGFLRAAVPVFTAEGRLFGAVVVDMDLDRLVSFLSVRNRAIDAYLADERGRLLLAPQGADRHVPIASRFPELQPLVGSDTAAHLPFTLVDEPEVGGYLAARRIQFDPQHPARAFLLAYHIPPRVAARELPRMDSVRLASSFALLLLAGAVLLWLLRRTFASLEGIAAAARAINTGHAPASLPVKGVRETREVAAALNATLAEITRREQEISAINAGLERQVAERTQQLQEANEHLRIKAQAATRQLRRAQALMDTAMDGIHVLDTEGRVVEVNDAFCRMLGYTRDELATMNVTDWDAGLPPDELQRNLAISFDHGLIVETVHRRKDGTLFSVELSSAGVDLDGKRYIYAASRDISERKRTEAAARRHRVVIETAPDGFWLADASGVLLEVNRAYARMSGYSQEELIGKHIKELEAREGAEDVAAHIAAVMRDGHDRFETRHRRKDGREIDVEISVSYLPETGHFFVFCHDITARKRAEAELRVAAAAFETKDAILITDAEARIIRVNSAFTEITGYEAQEVLGRNPGMMRSGRHDRDFYQQMWAQLTATGSWVGEIWDRRKNGEVYPKWMTITAVHDDRGAVMQYVAIFSDITERKNAEDEIRTLAFYDPLTRLPNRRLFLDRLHAALNAAQRHRRHGALLFIDMDRFKVLNDTLGHEYGDMMLIEVAARITSCVRGVDTVARLGGDEFVVLVEGIAAVEDDASRHAAVVGEKIRAALAAPYLLRQHVHHSSPSIGITLFQGADRSMDELLQHADQAMYRAKQSGRNAVRFFDPDMQERASAHDLLAHDLRGGLSRHELELYYQIQVDRDDRPVCVEALLRWRHPSRGLLEAGEFLALAEESGLIVELDQWVLERACGDVARLRGLTLAVNVSGRFFNQADVVERVGSVLARYRIDPKRLRLEIAEGVVLRDLDSAAKTMTRLREIGVSLALDRFGTGHCSIICLRRLPIDQIKLDRSLVASLGDAGADVLLVRTALGLARNFGLASVAVGVENETQRTLLRSFDCDLFQGHLVGRPVPAAALVRDGATKTG